MTLVAMKKKKTVRDGRPGPWGYGPLAAWLQETFKEDTRLALDQTLGVVRLGYLQQSLHPSVNPSADTTTMNSCSQLVTHYRSNVLESVPQAVLLMSRTGTIFAGNKRMASWLHLPLPWLSSRKLLYFHLVSTHDVPKVMDAYAAAAKTCASTVVGDASPDDVSAGAEVTHDFVLDRRTLLVEGTSSNRKDAASPPVLPDGNPAMISFRGHATIQPILDTHTGTRIPHFFAIYVAKTTWSSSYPSCDSCCSFIRPKALEPIPLL